MMNILFLTVCFVICGVWSKITIHGPESLKKKFKDSDYTIEVVYSNYGHVPYGQSIVSFIFSF